MVKLLFILECVCGQKKLAIVLRKMSVFFVKFFFKVSNRVGTKNQLQKKIKKTIRSEYRMLYEKNSIKCPTFVTLFMLYGLFREGIA